MTPDIKNDAARSHGIQETSERIANDQEVVGLIGPAVKDTVAQYHSLLRDGLEQEVKRIIDEFQSATVDIESTVIVRVKARLMDLVQQEVRRIFDDTLSQAESAVIPTGLDNRRPIFGGQYPRNNNFRPYSDPDDGDNDNRDGGSRLISPAKPPAPPSSWAIPDLPVGNDSGHEDSPSPVEPEQPSENHNDTITNLVDNDLDDDHTELALDELDDSDTTYEGTVHLNVEANNCIREVVHFVRELRQKPQLRLLRLVGNNKMGVDIWLALREPLQLEKMLPQLEGVSVVSTPIKATADQEKRLSIRLLPIESSGQTQQENSSQPVTAKQQIIA